MSSYCTCRIDKDNCFWCDYQVVKESLETYKKANKRYREALEFYADKENYYKKENVVNNIHFDRGYIAREVLGIKTKLFLEIDSLESANKYKNFIEDNQDIEVISVKTLENNNILLTYTQVGETDD